MIAENKKPEQCQDIAEEISDEDLDNVSGGFESCYYAGKRYSHGAERDGQYCQNGSWV